MGVAKQKITRKKTSKDSKEMSQKKSPDLCLNCNVNRCSRQRVFSDETWTKLLLWNEISAEAVHKPLCDTCYFELRDILIDNMEDQEMVSSFSKKMQKEAEKTVLEAKNIV